MCLKNRQTKQTKVSGDDRKRAAVVAFGKRR